MNAKAQRQGSILLYSLFILLTLVAAGFNLALIMLFQITQTRNEDDALRSRYAAEAGVERGLDIVTNHRLNKQPGTPTNLDDTLSLVEGLSGSVLDGAGTYTFDASRTTQQVTAVIFSLRELESKQIDFYDVENPFVANTIPVESIAIDWVEGDTCTAGTSEIELVGTEFALNGAAVDTTPNELIIPCGGFTPSAGYDCRLIINQPTPGGNYTLRVKAKTCDISSAQLQAYSVDDAVAGSEQVLSSQVVITANGRFGHARASVQAEAPWRAAASGFTDYVLFNDGDIVK